MQKKVYHNTDCGCGHDHEHHHHEHHHQEHHHHEHGDHDHCHEEDCGCGHDHDHESDCCCDHDHESDCCCDHDHEEEHFLSDTGLEKRIFILEGLDCANCAAKIEAKIRQMPEIGHASLTFATKQLMVSAEQPDHLLAKIQEVADSVEDGITVTEKTKRKVESLEVKQTSFWNKPLFSIGVGAILFLLGEIMIKTTGISEQDLRVLPIFLIAYLILGGNILLSAGKNILKGQIFDENFLMCIATIGAFLIRLYPEAVGVMLFYRIGEYFEHRATAQSRSQIMEAVDLRPEVVNLVDGDNVKVIDAEDAKVGDILLVRPGDRIPLDGVIVDGKSTVDTSPVTGEPVPVMVKAGDQVLSGCVNTSGQLKLQVEKVLEESMVTRILDSVENAAASKPEIDKFITKFARIYTPFVVFFALAIAILLPLLLPGWNYFILNGDTAHSSVYTALTFLVISCPCALVLSVPLAFFSGIGAGSRRGILFKGGIVLEGLKNVKAVVMDKTGTITKGNFVVQNVISVEQAISSDELLSLSASCELSSTHPIGNSIVEAAEERNLEIERPSEVEEIAGHGICAVIGKGTVLCGNRKLMDRYQIDMTGYEKEGSGTEVLITLNGKWIGHIIISDTVKEDAKSSIESVKKLGITTVMLTGDAQENAEQVAAETGIDEVHAKLLPEDKFSELRKIRERYGTVMFVGDGINDAPVLAGADIGAAMGSGADAAIEAADVVFMNSEMKAIPEAINIAKMTGRISWQNVVFALAVKAVVMVTGLLGFANMWAAVFADTGVSVLCLLNSIRILKRK